MWFSKLCFGRTKTHAVAVRPPARDARGAVSFPTAAKAFAHVLRAAAAAASLVPSRPASVSPPVLPARAAAANFPDIRTCLAAQVGALGKLADGEKDVGKKTTLQECHAEVQALLTRVSRPTLPWHLLSVM